MNISDLRLGFFKSAFDTFDKDKDGYIELNFILELMKSIKIDITQEESSSIINELDIEKNGKIHFNEFMLFILRKYKEPNINENEDMKEVYQQLDPTGAGLNKEKLKLLINTISQKNGLLDKIKDEELDQMISEAENDDNKDIISFEAFMRIMSNK